MQSGFRRGIRAYGLSLLAFLVPGLAGFIVAKALGWSSVAQAAIFGVGFTAWLVILFVLDVYERSPITAPVWRHWGISGVGIFAGVGLWVQGDKSSGGQIAFQALAVALILATSVVPLALSVGALRREPPLGLDSEAVASA